ncbi:MAG: DUF1294 domain-containing protein [Verrucomicrobia bacterium]|nr:DUF1294 domain-containing protein [Verrucomicrobiota bacterium]
MTPPPRPSSPASDLRGRPVGGALLVVLALLVLPAVALAPLCVLIDWWVVASWPLALSVFTFFLYRSDKRRAVAGGDRTPEATLHLAALLGGWPGALLAQQRYRHKTAKVSFQFGYWTIVLLYQYLAADSLLGWRLTRAAAGLVRAGLG